MNDITVTDAAAFGGSASLLVSCREGAFLYDAGFGFCADKMADEVEDRLSGRMPKAIILTHSHYDHVMGSAYLADRWAGVPVIAGEYTAYVFTRPSARERMYNMDVNAAEELGGAPCSEDMSDRLHVDRVIADGEEVDICGIRLKAAAFPGHTQCSMGFYCEESKTLFSSETLGVYGEGVVMPILLTSFLQGVSSLERAAALEPENLVLPHYGMLRGKKACGEYFASAKNEFEWVKSSVIKWHSEGASEREMADMIRKRYFKGSICKIYPLKAFYLNTGYMIPTIIREFCGCDLRKN